MLGLFSKTVLRALICIALINAPVVFSQSVNPQQPGIASAHPLATKAGYTILEQGGNAFDAAVAVSAALSVVEPYSSGLGGGGFFLLYRSSDKLSTFVDAREVAPINAYSEMYLDGGQNVIPRVSLDGPLAAGIPGLPAALVYVSENYGSLPLSVVLKPAIELAEKGFPVYERLLVALRVAQEVGVMSPKFRQIFLPNNKLPDVGYVITQKELATTLKTIAEQGHQGFYDSQLTKTIIDETNKDGSIWSLADFNDYQVVERSPIKVDFNEFKLTLAPPPSSGGTTIATILNILQQYNHKQLEEADLIHLIVEGMRRAYQDRAAYLGDPDFVDVPIKKLIGLEHAVKHTETIDLNQATPIHLEDNMAVALNTNKGTETTHYSVIDNQGNRVATTQTINTWFGSGYMVPSAGFILNNEMDDFSAKPFAPNRYGLVHGEANSIEPKKRMLSSMTPTFIESDKGIAVLGTPGGAKIITMVLLSILNWTNGGSADEMTSLRRFHHQYLPDVIRYERGAFNKDTIKELLSKGHNLEEIEEYGNMQIVTMQKPNGKIHTSSDPRALIDDSVVDYY
jgi:gamma-glutamyltranspeptidase/glutathione hydrolase